MDTERWLRVGDIFERLLEGPESDREKRLSDLCGDDQQLRSIVESMLDSHESPRFSDAAIKTCLDNSHAQGTSPQRGKALRDSEQEGSRVGPWRLARRIGAGGMGVVWLADRADGQFKQRAALKLIKRGMDSEAVLARFLRERQILARLEHRNIAHLLDGGIAPDGRPYFAMEYVEGLPLLAYCDEHKLKLEDRLRLFLQVCAALRFAHAQHVVHRDIKPSNILVTADGSVKLLDFGIAKLLQGDDELTSTLTGTQREQPMTPAYAAPEQIAGGEITQATDVYALGCVFYELLSGRRPHDFSAASDAHSVLKIILATDPVAPGRLNLATAPVPSKRLRGDLDTIALTALKQMPARRYASVAAFAADIENYLAGKPISARRDHIFYRGYKFLRRHCIGVAAITAIALVAFIGAMLFWREHQARGFIGENASVAVVEFANLSKEKQDSDWIAPVLAEQLASELAVSGKVHALPGELVSVAHADLQAPAMGGYAAADLAKLRKRLDADYVLSGSYFVSIDGGDQTFRLDLALQDLHNGFIKAMSTQKGALADLPRVVEKTGEFLREKLGVTEVTQTQLQEIARARPATLDLSQRMGNALTALTQGDAARARAELIEATTIAPDYAPAHLYLSKVQTMLGYDGRAMSAAQRAVANSDGLPAEMRLRIDRQLATVTGDWSKALELDAQLVASDVKNPELRLDLIGDLVSARKPDLADKALLELRKLVGSKTDPQIELAAVKIADAREDHRQQLQHAELALRYARERDEPAFANDALYDLGRANYNLGSYSEAERLLNDAIEGYKRLGNPRVEANAHQFLAFAKNERGDTKAAAEEYQKALAIYQRIGNNVGIAQVYLNLVPILWERGDHDAAETAVRRAQQINREIGRKKDLAVSLVIFASLKMDDAVDDAVVKDFREALDIAEQIGSPALQVNAAQKYAEALRLRGDLDGAQKLCEVARAKAATANSPALVLSAEYRCAVIALDRGELAVASAAFASAQSIATKIDYGDTVADIDVWLSRIDMGHGDCVSAAAHLRRSIERFTKEGDADKEGLSGRAIANALLASCLVRLGDTAGGDAALQEASKLRPQVTGHRKAFDIDLALARAGNVDAPQSLDSFSALAEDAGRRSWLGSALEAQLSAWRCSVRMHDPAAPALQRDLEASARQHGFKWVLTRMSTDSA